MKQISEAWTHKPYSLNTALEAVMAPGHGIVALVYDKKYVEIVTQAQAMLQELKEALSISEEPDTVDLKERETRIVDWKRRIRVILAAVEGNHA